MRGKKVRIAMAAIAVICIVAASIALYQPAMNYLGRQAGNPTGLIGSLMTRIWSVTFNSLHQWGFSHVNLSDEDVILVVGFGSGSGIRHIKGINSKNTIHGIDISEEAVKTATSLNQTYVNAGDVLLSVCNVADLAFDDDFFHLVVAGQTHMYWGEELKKGLSECHRVLKQGGTLLITSEIDTLEYFLPEYKEHDHFVALLHDVGFREVNCKVSGNYVAFICIK